MTKEEQEQRSLDRIGTSASYMLAELTPDHLREGLEETLTVLKLGLPLRLRRFLATTNSIENLVGSIRRVTRNVKRWRGTDMIRRWTGLGLFNAAKRFRRIKGYREMPKLVAALRTVESKVEVA